MAPPRDWFAQLEKKLTKVVRDRRQKRQIKQLLEAAKEDRKRQNDEKSYPTVRVTAIKPKRVEELFKINKATFKGPAPWGISPDDSVEVPLSLIESLERKHRLFRKADENEALVRTKIDAVLKTAWGIKQHTNVQIQLERKLKVNLPIDKPNVTIVGTADYAIWYGEEVDDESTCVCVIEAKAPGKDGRFQALSYMSMILNIRERDGCTPQAIWGVATDATDWRFIRLLPDRTYSMILYSLDSEQLPEILGLLAAIMDQAAVISPVSSLASWSA